MTRMLCPPPSFDSQISAQAQYIRSFLLRDGKLHLSLMADGGIIVWDYTFKGKKYVKGKRIRGGKAPQGNQVLASGITFETGIPLTPRK